LTRQKELSGWIMGLSTAIMLGGFNDQVQKVKRDDV